MAESKSLQRSQWLDCSTLQFHDSAVRILRKSHRVLDVEFRGNVSGDVETYTGIMMHQAHFRGSMLRQTEYLESANAHREELAVRSQRNACICLAAYAAMLKMRIRS